MFLLDFCTDSAAIWKLTGQVINIFKIVIPIIIVLLAMVDLGKAVMAGEEKEIKTAQKLVIKRLIYGVVLFFAVTIVQTVFGLVDTNYKTGGDDIEGAKCWTCVLTPNSEGADGCKGFVKTAKDCQKNPKKCK